MSRSIIIIVLSLLTALFPHLGFPGSIKNAAVTILALGIAVLGYMAYREARKRELLKHVDVGEITIDTHEEENLNA